MARIRTIKPEFWQDEKLAPLRPIDRLVFLGLISQADDAGRLVDSPRMIDGLLFPYSEDCSRESIEILTRLGRVLRYTSDSGQKLLQIVNWSAHQKVINPAKYVLPGPTTEDCAGQEVAEPSLDSKEDLNRSDVSDLRPTTPDQRSTTNDPPPQPDGFAEVVELWEQASGKIVSPLLASDITNSLETAGLERVRKAIQITAKAGATSWSYVEGVLRRGGDRAHRDNGADPFPAGHPAHGREDGERWEGEDGLLYWRDGEKCLKRPKNDGRWREA